MRKTLKDFFGNDDFEQAWLWCDIDGHGPQWELVIPLDDAQISFPHDNFEDYAEHYLDYPAREIVKPMHPHYID